ncbi:hypothetical protein QMK17_06125 [Rhodococcus sp. G-MC3]|uniref:hypothetical protein n=1 Tax=Rhodococcus sp. G-MC3 TaxID=3046209 RepID=UPI0024BBB1E1|nr:hypothetical protein [Rhodococcus sp. G-MC3]MDJ0392906.1 hypothetical protein [Rhodococcus sp. G-MC3]
MIPLMARKYIYRYLIIALALPLIARILILAGVAIEKRTGTPNVASNVLKKTGSFAQRRAEKSSGKHHGG